MSEQKRILQCIGPVMNITDYLTLGKLAENWSFSRELTPRDYNLAAKYGVVTVPVGAKQSLSAVMREFTPAWAARMVGGSVDTDHREKWTTEVITKVGNTVTLTNGAAANQSVVMVGSVIDVTAKTARTKVASSPVAGNSYTLATNVLTFHADDTGTQFEVTYIWDDTTASSGVNVVIPTQAMPGKVRVILPYSYLSTVDGTISKTLCIDCKNVQPLGNFTIGGNAQDDIGIGFEAAVLNEIAGDITMYFDDYNPGN